MQLWMSGFHSLIISVSTCAASCHGFAASRRLTFPQTSIMETENFIESMGKDLGVNASVESVYGEPIQAGDKTIIPVARIRYGFGGGFGHGKKTKEWISEPGLFTGEEKPDGEGAGGGGGFSARPNGVYEITADRTRFIPANSTAQLLMGIALGFLVKAIFFSRKKAK